MKLLSLAQSLSFDLIFSQALHFEEKMLQTTVLTMLISKCEAFRIVAW